MWGEKGVYVFPVTDVLLSMTPKEAWKTYTREISRGRKRKCSSKNVKTRVGDKGLLAYGKHKKSNFELRTPPIPLSHL
jgi:hypothetical protein